LTFISVRCKLLATVTESLLASRSPSLNSTPQSTPSDSPRVPQARRLTLFALISLIFFTTSGGAFGIEPLVGAVGPGWAVLLMLLTPLVWSLPMALMVAELASLMPEEGGYYVWVRETIGPFWAVQEAWWSLAYSTVLLAIFPVLFVSYLSYFIPAIAPAADLQHPVLGPLLRWFIAVLLIASAAFLNLRGARDVGISAKFSATIVCSAFAALVLTWIAVRPNPAATFQLVVNDLRTSHRDAVLLGISLIVLNYSGWDNASTYANEVEQPRRNYPLAIGLALLLVVAGYVLPVLAGISVTTDPALWSSDAGWPVISKLIGGPWLGALLSVAGLVSTWAMFNAQLLYVTRLPFVMAQDRWLPEIFARVSPVNGSPQFSIICISLFSGLLATLSFGGLAVIQCVLYTAALTLEFLALILLRLRRPHAYRRFRVPGGWLGISCICVAFFSVALVVLVATLREWRDFPGQLAVVAIIVFSGAALYLFRRTIVLPPDGKRRWS